MAELVKIPYKQKMMREDGYLTDTWAKFFRGLFIRAGGTTGQVGGTDISVLNNANSIEDLKLRLEALEQEPSS